MARPYRRRSAPPAALAQARPTSARTTAARMLGGLGADSRRPGDGCRGRRVLGFLEGAILDRIAHDDLSREQQHGMLLGAFAGALLASGREWRAADRDAARVRPQVPVAHSIGTSSRLHATTAR